MGELEGKPETFFLRLSNLTLFIFALPLVSSTESDVLIKMSTDHRHLQQRVAQTSQGQQQDSQSRTRLQMFQQSGLQKKGPEQMGQPLLLWVSTSVF